MLSVCWRGFQPSTHTFPPAQIIDATNQTFSGSVPTATNPARVAWAPTREYITTIPLPPTSIARGAEYAVNNPGRRMLAN